MPLLIMGGREGANQPRGKCTSPLMAHNSLIGARAGLRRDLGAFGLRYNGSMPNGRLRMLRISVATNTRLRRYPVRSWAMPTSPSCSKALVAAGIDMPRRSAPPDIDHRMAGQYVECQQCRCLIELLLSGAE